VARPEGDAEQPADEGQRRRLDEELPENLPGRVAPSALRSPISRVRSVTETIMMAMTPIPPTSRATLRGQNRDPKKVVVVADGNRESGLRVIRRTCPACRAEPPRCRSAAIVRSFGWGPRPGAIPSPRGARWSRQKNSAWR
jgi:hypothetical protein